MNEILTTIIDFIRSDTLDKLIYLFGVLASDALAWCRAVLEYAIS